MRGLRDRSLRAPLVAVGDGALGLWAALREVFPTTQHQRCWNHRVRNVQDKLPQRLKGEARPRLRATGQGSAADTVLRDWDAFVTFYRFPKDYWLHLRTTNPLESVFAGVRLRTDATTRMRTRETALALVFKLIERLGPRWRCLNGGATLMRLVLDGDVFVNGVRQRPAAPAA